MHLEYLSLPFGFAFIWFLFHNDVARRGHLPRTLWVPFIWALVKGSRPVALWFHTGGVDEISGNPYDAVLDLALIIGAWVTLRGKHPWRKMLAANPMFVLIVVYFLVSILWSPFPYVASKRWFREIGNVLVALVILTEAKPAEAFKVLAVRCAYVLVPLSVILYRYFPEYGKVYTNGGFATITGVTTQKNSLGIMCAVLGLALVWDIIDTKRQNKTTGTKFGLKAQWFALGVIVYLLRTADSKTSILALVLGCAILLSTYIKPIRDHATLFARACIGIVVTGLIAATLWTVSLSGFFHAIGRDTSFTERDQIWTAVLEQPINPLIGNGFYMFWLRWGPNVAAHFTNFIPKSAHNGYLETYLDGGILGCIFMFMYLFSTSFRTAKLFSHEHSVSRVVFAIVMMALVTNLTESYFFRLDIFWFCLVIASLAARGALLPQTAVQKEGLPRKFVWSRPTVRVGVVSK